VDWEELNSITVDTVIKIKKKEKTVSKNLFQQYQNQPPNSITVDTRNHINKSSNEIGEEKTKLDVDNLLLTCSFLTNKIKIDNNQNTAGSYLNKTAAVFGGFVY
jgi:hypothetical protein